eukprot:1192340-Prorocentrum_minimum.AAC.2
MKEMRDKKYKVKPNFMDIHPTGEHFEAYENIELKQFLVLVKSREIAKVMEFFGYAPREEWSILGTHPESDGVSRVRTQRVTEYLRYAPRDGTEYLGYAPRE